jgi:hypothetical protein
LDILLRLSVYDEDWYVEKPANAALKAMVRSFPAVLDVFFCRLRSDEPDERAHAALQLMEIAEREPELLDAPRLRTELARLAQLGDKEAASYIGRAIVKLKRISA